MSTDSFCEHASRKPNGHEAQRREGERGGAVRPSRRARRFVAALRRVDSRPLTARQCRRRALPQLHGGARASQRLAALQVRSLCLCLCLCLLSESLNVVRVSLGAVWMLVSTPPVTSSFVVFFLIDNRVCLTVLGKTYV